MDETKRAWNDVGEGFEKLGRIISERYRRLGEERGANPPAAEERAVGEAIRQATDELDRAFTALGDTLRNGDARDHVRDTGRKLAEAVKVTLTEVGDEVRKAVGGRESGGPGEPPDAVPPSGPPEPGAPN
jgi:hypothetical protein